MASGLGQLNVSVLGAKNLSESTTGSSNDPYFKVRVGNAEYVTKIAVGGRSDPTFDDTFSFEVDPTAREITIEAWFKQQNGSDLMIAQATRNIVSWVGKNVVHSIRGACE